MRRIGLDDVQRAVGQRVRRLAGEAELRAGQAQQRSLYLQYRALRDRPGDLPPFADTGFRVYSGADEDGLLLYVFALAGMGSKVCVEIALGSPDGANTTNLLCNWGWTGLLVEGDPALHEAGERFFARHRDTRIHPPRIVREWVTAENVNQLLAANGLGGEIDLLSLDIDGVDWWVWRSLEVVRPRVVVVEVQDIWGPERAVTVPYRPDFTRPPPGPDHDHFGASLPAFVQLGREKGYRLVGANRYGFNAVFVASGVAEDLLPEVDAASCLAHPKVAEGRRERLPLVAHLPWVDV